MLLVIEGRIRRHVMRATKTILICTLPLLLLGCKTLASKNSTGVVVARRAQIRSSTAVVAADLLQVNRGDQVDILDSSDVTDPTDNTKKERWLRVKAHDEETTEGWIESRNVMPEEVVDASKKIAAEDNGIPAQASGPRNNKQSDENNEPEETNELWYKVRLPSSISPAPAGWIYGKQVELSVPSDIIFYRTGREFVAWQRLDGEASSSDTSGKKDVGKEGRPGSWVILEKSSSDQPHTLDEPDFDRIYVLGYDKRDQEHYTAYRSPDLRGFLPCRVVGAGENKTFTIRVQDDNGQTKDVQYGLYRDARGFLKVTAPNLANREKKRR